MVPFANSATHFMVPADTEDGPVLVLLAATKVGAGSPECRTFPGLLCSFSSLIAK